MLLKCSKPLFFILISLFSSLLYSPLGNTFTPKKPANSTPQKKSSQEKQYNEYLWVNDFHESVSDSVFQSAKWFDEFFQEEGAEMSNPKTQARIRLGWIPRSRDWSEIEAKFRLKVRLPHLSQKVDLILSDEEEHEQDGLPIEGVGTKTGNQDEHFTAALRVVNRDTKSSQLESRIGLSGGDIFSRIRYKKKYTWFDKHSFSFTPSIYYYLDDGLGEKLLLEYTYQLKATEQLRFDYSIRGSESFSGIRWHHGLYKLTQINETTASIWGFQVEGERNGDDGFLIKNYTLSYRYRFNALKKWVYFEIEPFLEWPEDENYTTTPGIALSIEGYFEKRKR